MGLLDPIEQKVEAMGQRLGAALEAKIMTTLLRADVVKALRDLKTWDPSRQAGYSSALAAIGEGE